jgi:predicted porin
MQILVAFQHIRCYITASMVRMRLLKRLSNPTLFPGGFMKKKVLFAAVGAALVAGPMLASAAEVKLYGHAHVSLDVIDLDDNPGTAANESAGGMFVASNSSRFGIRATEDLGGGLKGVAQYELLFSDITTTGGSLSTNRDNYVGLEGKFGSVRLGVIDSATKDIGGLADLFYREQLGEGRAITAIGGFDDRIDNGIHWISPNFGGATVKVQYGVEDSNTSDLTEQAINLIWKGGALALGAGYQGEDLSATTDQSAIRLGGSFTAGAFKVTALWQSTSDEGGVSGADRDIMGVGASFTAGSNVFKVQYYTADARDNATTTAGGGCDQTSLGWDHNFTKTTRAYVTYADMSNDSNAACVIGGNGHAGVIAAGEVANGGDNSGFSFGMIMDF